MTRELLPHASHWGAFEAEVADGTVVAIHPYRHDPDPSPLLGNIVDGLRHRARITQPMVRAGWLDRGPGPDARRGAEPFVPLEWPRATDLLARELRRVYDRHGGSAVYGGSYGWASAGRFHHAQSQLHRFLNCLGGYVRSVNNYSFGTSSVLLPHVVGDMNLVMAGATAWPVIAEHTDLLVAFGGLSPKNSAVASGGIGRHTMAPALASAVAGGCRIISVGPLRSDTDVGLGAEWIAPVPGTDAALMLALCHVLDSEGLADRRFLDRYTVGYPRFAAYVRGAADDVPKTPEWAAALTGIAAERIRALARQMAAGRTLVTVSWSLQRAQHGEQPVWLGLVLAAMLGQIGLPGGGFGHGYGSTGDVGIPRRLSAPRLPQGANDIGAGSGDSTLFAMPQLTGPHAHARDDYDIFGALADRLQVGEAFKEGRTGRQWLLHLYEQWRSDMKAAGHEMPEFEEFWASESLEIPVPDPRQVLLSAFRRDPGGSPLRTPSGKIEIFSAAIDGFGYPDCPGHPVWLEPAEWLGGHP